MAGGQAEFKHFEVGSPRHSARVFQTGINDRGHSRGDDPSVAPTKNIIKTVAKKNRETLERSSTNLVAKNSAEFLADATHHRFRVYGRLYSFCGRVRGRVFGRVFG